MTRMAFACGRAAIFNDAEHLAILHLRVAIEELDEAVGNFGAPEFTRQAFDAKREMWESELFFVDEESEYSIATPAMPYYVNIQGVPHRLSVARSVMFEAHVGSPLPEAYQDWGDLFPGNGAAVAQFVRDWHRGKLLGAETIAINHQKSGVDGIPLETFPLSLAASPQLLALLRSRVPQLDEMDVEDYVVSAMIFQLEQHSMIGAAEALIRLANLKFVMAASINRACHSLTDPWLSTGRRC